MSTEKSIELTGFTESEYAGDQDDRKSNSGYIFKYGNCFVSWNSSKQKTVTFSSTESEYIGISNAAKKVLWLKHILVDLGRSPRVTLIYCDNKSAYF